MYHVSSLTAMLYMKMYGPDNVESQNRLSFCLVPGFNKFNMYGDKVGIFFICFFLFSLFPSFTIFHYNKVEIFVLLVPSLHHLPFTKCMGTRLGFIYFFSLTPGFTDYNLQYVRGSREKVNAFIFFSCTQVSPITFYLKIVTSLITSTGQFVKT